jgi:MYXO-CTERM domain-containing protein
MRSTFLSALAATLALSSVAIAGGPQSARYANDTNGLFWFFHISDLHTQESSSAASDALKAALGDGVKLYKPAFVMATGDLTDASLLGVPCSGQVQSEWDEYKAVVKAAGMTPEFYFDVPGNHDSYGDNGLKHYLDNSVQGQATGQLFTDWTVEIPGAGTYYFFAANSNGTYGQPLTWGNPAFPTDELEFLEARMQEHQGDELIIVGAHHPLSAYKPIDWQDKMGLTGKDPLPANVDQMRSLLKTYGAFYLHGHIHETKEYLDCEGQVVVNQIDGLGQSTTGNIGVVAIDHNAVVYRATSSSKLSPFLMITAPVDRYLNGGGKSPDDIAYGTEQDPYAYSVCKDRKDNPVRALLFSSSAPTSVNLLVDGSKVGVMKADAAHPEIWVAQLDTTTLSAALHKVEVVATVGAEEARDAVQVQFIAGPCEPWPVDGGADAPEAEVGPDAPADAPAKDVATDSDDGGLGVQSAAAESGSDGGCDCSASRRMGDGALAWLFGLGLLAGLRRRR